MLKISRAGFKFTRWHGRGRADFIGFQGIQQLVSAKKHPGVRTEVFIGQQQKIAIQILNINGAVRRVLHGININQRSSRVRQADQLFTGFIVPTAFAA